MKKNKIIGIIQPGRIGDIFLCLPIAKHYYDMGYNIVWPVFHNIYNMFQDRINYVDFIPVSDNVYSCVDESKKILSNCSCSIIFDIAATFPGSHITGEYIKQGEGFGEVKFDEFKYNFCQVPFDKKWSLSFERDEDAENRLYNLYIKEERYAVIGLNHSQGRARVQIESDKQIVEINEYHNIFDWLKILENADQLVLVESAMSNLVEQINLPNKKWLLRKEGHPMPVYKNKWTIQ